ncbi:MAG: hypothetical protein IPO09_19410 [Anaeromyxobacter sp.]|nr:hypothetical protein [Anaeromyxobacter sp.]
MTLRRAVAVLLALAALPALAADALKPFVLASRGAGDPAPLVAEVRAKLGAAGFQIAGSYQPYPEATVLVVTSDLLKAAAAAVPGASYGAAQRVTVTTVGDEVQVAYTNPVYMQFAYRMKTDLSSQARKLEAALGRVEEYGPSDPKSPKQLKGYHYMFGMPYFDEPVTIASFPSHAEAVAAVEAGLAARRGGASKVSRIDLPGTEDVLFGVALTDGCGGDASVMKEIDFKPLRSTGHLPYDLLVSGGQVLALHAKFRIAVNFPDLSMMGAHSFMGIRCAPDSIEGALKRVAGAAK